MSAIIDGNRIVNATPHEIRFQSATGEIVIVEKCGKTLAAKPTETVVSEYHGVTLVKTMFVASEQGAAELAELMMEYPGAFIVGSIISAQAFPGRVVSLVPVPGTERSAPADKIYLPNKFNTF